METGTATSWAAPETDTGTPEPPVEGAQPQPQQQASGEFVCEVCNRTFARAQSLGIHKRQAHGIAGTGRKGSGRKKTEPRSQPKQSVAAEKGLDTDRLLRDLFPNGLPARQEVLSATAEWLTEAERIAKMR